MSSCKASIDVQVHYIHGRCGGRECASITAAAVSYSDSLDDNVQIGQAWRPDSKCGRSRPGELLQRRPLVQYASGGSAVGAESQEMARPHRVH